MLDLEVQLHYLYIKADAYCQMGYTTCRHFKEASQKFHECGGLFQVMPSPAPFLFKFTASRGVLGERFRKHGSIVKVQAAHHSATKGDLNQIPVEPRCGFSPCCPCKNEQLLGLQSPFSERLRRYSNGGGRLDFHRPH